MKINTSIYNVNLQKMSWLNGIIDTIDLVQNLNLHAFW